MKYDSNISEVVLQLKHKLQSAADVNKLTRLVATYLTASNTRRVHNDGNALDESQIGQYNTNNPLYINPNKAPRKFKPEGRTGKTIFKSTGKPHKTKFFANYSGFRSNQGRANNRVNLQLTGKLKLDWAMEQQGNDWIIGFKSDYGAKIAEGMEDKYKKKIWGVSERDKKAIAQIEQEFITEQLNKAA